MSDTLLLATAMTTLIASLFAGVIAYKKLKPETTSIQVTTADTVVAMTAKAAALITQQRDELAIQVGQLREQVSAFEGRMRDLERKAWEAERLKSENTQLRRENKALREENARLKAREGDDFPTL